MRGLCFMLLLLLPQYAVAQTLVSDRTIVISATGVVEREPDIARLMVTVETVAAAAQTATAANAARMQTLLEALQREGIVEDLIRTVSYDVVPEYGRPRMDPPREPEIMGYRVRNTVQITIEALPRAGAIIDAALAAGANRVSGLTFGLRDTEQARREALAQAITKARADAEVLAEAAGHQVGQLLTIQTVTQPGIVRSLAFEEARVMADVSTPIEPGTLRVTATLSAVFRLER